MVLSVAGDWAYIPAAWKAIADEDPRYGIPTTYYGAVQVTGPAQVIDEHADRLAQRSGPGDPAARAHLLRRLSDQSTP